MKAFGPNGYNLTIGGNSLGSGEIHPRFGKPSWNKGKQLSEAHRKNISKPRINTENMKKPKSTTINMKKSDESKKKISQFQKGRRKSMETIEKIKQGMLKYHSNKGGM